MPRRARWVPRVAHHAAVLFNVGLRIAIVAFTIDALINAADPRFEGKALGPLNVGELARLTSRASATP